MTAKFPYKIVDLTHTLNSKTPSWDESCGFNHEIKLDYSDCQTNTKFRVQHIKMHAGIGTHIDAPAHCTPGSTTVDQLALEDLIVPCICIDVSARMSEEYRLSTEDVLKFETKHGAISAGSFVIVHTGWSCHWHDPKKYRNDHKFPSISLQAAELLLERNIVGIGIDAFSPDVPPSGFPVHKLFLEAKKYIVENIANADDLPAVGSFILVMPIKAAGLTEAPVRLIGLIKIHR